VRYLQTQEATGVDWKMAGQNGVIELKPDAQRIRTGMEDRIPEFTFIFLNAPGCNLCSTQRILCQK